MARVLVNQYQIVFGDPLAQIVDQLVRVDFDATDLNIDDQFRFFDRLRSHPDRHKAERSEKSDVDSSPSCH